MGAITWTGLPARKSTKSRNNKILWMKIGWIRAWATAELLWTSFKERKNKCGKLIDAPETKRVQKHTSLKRDDVEMRNRPQRMTCYPKKKIGSFSTLSGCDPRIRTPLNRRPSDVWHNVIKGWKILIRIDRLPNDRNPKSFNHYPRSNGELNTLYPTPNKGVGIIDVVREVREELSNQGGRGWMIYLQQGQLASTLRVCLNGRINLI